MRRTGLLLVAVALGVLAVWAVYGYAEGPRPSSPGPAAAIEQPVGCTPSACETAGCCRRCVVCPDCPDFTDEDGDGVCDIGGACGGHANDGCQARKGCCGR